MTIFGHQALMQSAQCQRKNSFGCEKQFGELMLTDRKGKKLPVHTHCRFCYNTIYNYLPLNLIGQAKTLKQLWVKSFRMDFVREDTTQMEQMLAAYEQAFYKELKILPSMWRSDYTNGHWRRGVE
jgi:putative protease